MSIQNRNRSDKKRPAVFSPVLVAMIVIVFAIIGYLGVDRRGNRIMFLPYSLPSAQSADAAPRVDVARITVTREGVIYLDDEAVATVEDAKAALPDGTIGKLDDALTKLRANDREMVLTGRLETEPKDILVLLDRHVDFDVLLKILNTCDKFGYPYVGFAVTGEAGDTAFIGLSLPPDSGCVGLPIRAGYSGFTEEDIRAEEEKFRPKPASDMPTKNKSAKGGGGGDPRRLINHRQDVLGIVSGKIRGGGDPRMRITTRQEVLVPRMIYPNVLDRDFAAKIDSVLLTSSFKAGPDRAPPTTTETAASRRLVSPGREEVTGGRSRVSIRRIVMQGMPALRYDYNRRLRDKPDLQGVITVKFAIEEFGAVTFAQIVESTVNDPELERTVVDRVKSWYFDRIDKPGDITEVVYPFHFSQ